MKLFKVRIWHWLYKLNRAQDWHGD